MPRSMIPRIDAGGRSQDASAIVKVWWVIGAQVHRIRSREEYRRLIGAANTVRTWPYLVEKIILAVHTGLRRGSLCSTYGGIRSISPTA